MQLQVKTILPTLLITVGLAVLTVYIFFPGFLNMDSAWQLKMAATHDYVDWHPPIMSLLWGALNHLYYGPTSMLVLHNLIFWTALFLFALKLFPDSNCYRIILILCFGMFPAVYMQLGAIWKDTSFAVSLFLFAVLMLYLKDLVTVKYKLLLTLVMLPLLFYAAAVRLNSLPAILVLCYWLAETLFQWRWVKKLLFAILLAAGLFLLNTAIVEFWVHPLHSHPFQQVQIHDLAGISAYEHKLIFPNYILHSDCLTNVRIKEGYDPGCVGFLIFKDYKEPLVTKALVHLTISPTNLAELQKVWVHAIIAHPFVYLWHRTNVFLTFLISCVSYLGEVCSTPYEITFHASVFYNIYCNFLTSQLGMTFLHAWVYLTNSLFCLFVALAMRRRLAHYKPIFFASLSGILYLLPNFFYTPACEFRYIYWTVTASIFALILFLLDFFRMPTKTTNETVE